MIIKNKWFMGLLSLNVILAIVDIVLTMSIPHMNLFETNQIYTMTGSFIWLWIFNFLMYGVLTFVYIKTTKWYMHWLRYAIIHEFIIFLFLRVLAIKTLLDWKAIEPTLDYVKYVIAQDPTFVLRTQQQMLYTEIGIMVCGLASFLIWWFDNVNKDK